jgi:hypothetical protein
MKKITMSLILFSSLGYSFSRTHFKKINCAKESATDQFIYQSDYKWNTTLAEAGVLYRKMYESPKRLMKRAYFDKQTQQFKIPWYEDQGGEATLPMSFVKNVVAHIESALEQKVIDYVFFPDMGHSHFFIPEEKYQAQYNMLEPVRARFEMFFKDPELKILYHTAEQIKQLDENGQLLNDPRIQFRYQTRNLLGSNNGSREIVFLQAPDSKANTARDLPGYYYWGSGFNISANKKGCFYYMNKGKKVFFDLSLFDNQMDPSIPIGQD